MFDNALTNLKGGGDLKDLSALRVREINYFKFVIQIQLNEVLHQVETGKKSELQMGLERGVVGLNPIWSSDFFRVST